MSTDQAQPSTLSLTFDEQERKELFGLLDVALRNLRVEVHRTHTPDYREQLIQREGLLNRLIERFQRGG